MKRNLVTTLIIIANVLGHSKTFAHEVDESSVDQEATSPKILEDSSFKMSNVEDEPKNLWNEKKENFPYGIDFSGLVLPEDRNSIGENYLLKLIFNSDLNSKLKKDSQLKALHRKDKVLQKCLKNLCNENEKNSINLEEARKQIKKGLSMEFLYRGKAGIWEGYSIGEHTVKVLNVLYQQERHFHLFDLDYKYYSTHPHLRNLMWVIMSLHDVGKYLSVIINKKDAYQLAYIEPIYMSILRSMKIKRNQLVLARLLMNHDLIGKYLKGTANVTAKSVAKAMLARAKAAKMERLDYFDLQMLYFTSDAGSYQFLHGKVFETDSNTGKLNLMAHAAHKIEELKTEIVGLK